LLVFSICAVHYVINPPQVWGHEGHMRELIGYLDACRGAEEVAARLAAGIPQKFLRNEDRAYRARALIDDESIGARIAIGKIAISDTIRSVLTGSPTITIYARENFMNDAVEEIAGAIPGFGVLD
jgi:hypothetical protein